MHFFKSAVSRIDHILGHKAISNEFKKIHNFLSIFFGLQCHETRNQPQKDKWERKKKKNDHMETKQHVTKKKSQQ